MNEIVLFGGTTEGRELAELLQRRGIPALVCVATEYGEALLSPGGSLRVHTGRLDESAMRSLLLREAPRLVIDATHPYAACVSEQVRALCGELGLRRIRVKREALAEGDCVCFPDLDGLIPWLNQTEGTVFSTLGAKEASLLARAEGFAERIWLRILPLEESLRIVREAGFPAKRLICMQGPFSQELNEAMFRAADARILLTKDSGAAGGFAEKLAAARACGMTVALIARPADDDGTPLCEIRARIEENAL